MAISSSRVSVTSSATLIHTADGSTELHLHHTADTGSDIVDLGPSGVTSGNGFPLANGGDITVHLSDGQSLYGISEGTTATVAKLAIS